MQITTIVQQTMQKSNRIFNQKKEKREQKKCLQANEFKGLEKTFTNNEI
jgi:hypothetical protein